MVGFKLFKHAAMMVINNWREALQIGLAPAAIVLLAFAVLVGLGGVEFETTASDAVSADDMQGVLGVFMFILIYATCALWLFVNWHRFVLLEEYPKGWMTPLRFDRMLAYLGRGLLIGALILLPMTVAMAGVGFFAAAIFGNSSNAAIFVVPLMLALSLFVMIAFYRLCPLLPAAAIGQGLTIGQSWEATTGSAGAILLLLLVQFLFQLALGVIVFLSLSVFLPIGLFFQLVATLFQMLLGVSILTTFYGYYIEKRDLTS